MTGASTDVSGANEMACNFGFEIEADLFIAAMHAPAPIHAVITTFVPIHVHVCMYGCNRSASNLAPNVQAILCPAQHTKLRLIWYQKHSLWPCMCPLVGLNLFQSQD